MKFKHLIVATALAVTSFFAMPSAEARSSRWFTCGYQKTHMINVDTMLCRMIELSNTAIRVEWEDGAADVFTHLGNRKYIDSRGGYWYQDSGVSDGYDFIRFRSLSTGTVVVIISE